MHRIFVPFGAALAICLATASCAAPTTHAMMLEAEAPPPEIEEALSLSIDTLDVRHGSLRIEASMADGSADVSMWLGTKCETREVGRGFATRSGFAWSLTRDEVARAIECNLVVRVRASSGDGQRVRKIAQLPVSVGLEADDADSVRLVRQRAVAASTRLSFLARARARRLHVAGTVIGAEADEEPVSGGAFVSSFVVGNDDLARSIVGRRRMTVLGEHFLATISVGSMRLEVEEPTPELLLGSSCGDF